MADKVLKIDPGRFTEAAERMLAQSKREHEVVMREQMKGVIRALVRMTPPGSSRTESFASAKQRGLKKTAADINKVLQGAPKAEQEVTNEGGLKAAHERARSGGQVKGESNGAARVKVPKGMLRDYIKKRQQLVGHLAAGWNKAARDLGIALPSWITRHQTEGSLKLDYVRGAIRMRATNRAKYAGEVEAMAKRVRSALDFQAGQMFKRVAKANAVAAKKAGFKSGKKR